jgi:hypothetical protein
MEQCAGTAGRNAMNEDTPACPYKLVHDVQWTSLREDLSEMRARVQRLEAILARGVTLLVANLVGVIVLLLHQLI